MVKQASYALKRHAGKAAEALSAIAGSVVNAILNFIDEAIGSPSEHKQALIALVAGLLVACIVVWLKQKVKKLKMTKWLKMSWFS